MTGDCYCKEGYTGELCNKCSEGYHDSIQTPLAPTCTGMKNQKYCSFGMKYISCLFIKTLPFINY